MDVLHGVQYVVVQTPMNEIDLGPCTVRVAPFIIVDGEKQDAPDPWPPSSQWPICGEPGVKLVEFSLNLSYDKEAKGSYVACEAHRPGKPGEAVLAR